MNTPKVAIYARVASAGQLDAQIDMCKSLATRMSTAECSAYSDNGYSATTESRPGLIALRAAIRSGDTDIVITRDLDRLFRSSLQLLKFISEAKKHNVRVITLDGFDSTTPELSQDYLGLLAVKAAVSERIKRGIAVSKARKLAGLQ